jgi:hypothetical protein
MGTRANTKEGKTQRKMDGRSKTDYFLNFILFVPCIMTITTYNIGSGTSVNFIQEYGSVTLSTVSTFLYL